MTEIRGRCGLLILGGCLLVAAGVGAAEPGFLVGGIQVHEPDSAHWTETLRQVGMNTVAVTVYARQGEWDGDQLTWSDDEPAVIGEIRAARSRGLAVVLVLRVAVDHFYARNKFVWHGMIMPRSDELLRSWFASYTRFVTRWAATADAEGVEILGIGSEMNALNSTLPIGRWGNLKNYRGFYWYQRLSRHRARKFAEQIEQSDLQVQGFENYETLDEFLDARFRHTTAWARQAYLRPGARTLRRINLRRELIEGLWTELIAATREVYGGKLTYAANFDSYRNVGFWNQLDMIGINAYFSLLPTVDDEMTSATRIERFRESWQRILGEIEAFKEGQGLGEMPFLFTEFGYTFRRHSTVEPWAHAGFSVVGWRGHRRRLIVWGDQPIDYAEREDALVALRSVHRETESDLAGILYWKLSTIRDLEEIEPFMVHVGRDSTDGTQRALVEFNDPRR